MRPRVVLVVVDEKDPAHRPQHPDEIVARLANVTHVGFNEVNAKINALVDSQIRTEENLRNLVAVVDRYFSEGRNGKSI